jgi:methionine-gamma-lyase
MSLGLAQKHLEATRKRAHARCVACGSVDGRAPRLRFAVTEDGSVEAAVQPSSADEGYKGMLHGGVIATLLDAAMTNCLFAHGRCGVTGQLSLRFRHPVASNKPLRLRAWVERSSPPLFILRGELWQADLLRATAVGKFMEPRPLGAPGAECDQTQTVHESTGPSRIEQGTTHTGPLPSEQRDAETHRRGPAPGFNTRLVHGHAAADPYGAVNVPIYQSSTFAFRNAAHGAALFAGRESGYIYTRIGNPTIRALEDTVAGLEGGCAAVATSSGLGAVTAVYMALLEAGAHLVSTASVYGPSRGLVEQHLARFGVQSSYVDTSDVRRVQEALQPNTRLIYVETPSNPAMQVTDLRAVADVAREHACALVVDNTFASPYLQRPLELGADVVLHSVTKFINGHADVVGGIAVTRTEELQQRIRTLMINLGSNMDPHQAFLVLRGLKTLALRVERAQQSAMRIARHLEAHPKVAWVRYIGLPSHPQHELVRRQMRGSGSMISFELKGGLEAGVRLMDQVRLATLAVSLGGVETLIEHPASMTHAGISRDQRLAAGITDGLVRYSVGIEDVEDLLADLDQALADA